MHLAQELVDYIIDFLHNNPEDLKRVSLVSRAWVSRARTHLCESLKITRLKLESLNPSYLTPLCGYVKSLHFTWPMDLTGPPAALDCFGISELHTLTIHSCELHNLNEQIIRQCFATFPCASITTLELHHISPTHRTLLTLLSMFPNVDNLTVSVNRWWADRLDPGPPGSGQNETIQLISLPRLRGSFKLVDSFDQGLLGFHHNNLLRTIATLPLQFQTVTLNFEDRYWMEILSFLNSCSKTVIKVYIVKLPYRKPALVFYSQPSVPTVQPCSEPTHRLATCQFREPRGTPSQSMDHRQPVYPTRPPSLAIGSITMSTTGSCRGAREGAQASSSGHPWTRLCST